MNSEENSFKIDEVWKKNIEFVANYQNFSNCCSDEQFLNTIIEISEHILPKNNIIKFINWACTVKFQDGLLQALEECISKDSVDSIDQMKKFMIAKRIFNIFRSYSNHSLKFCSCVYVSNGLKVIFKYLNDEHFREQLNTNDEKYLLHELLRSILGCLVNLSQLYPVHKNEWKVENSTQLILELSKNSNFEDTQIACHVILARTSEEEEIIKFPNLIEIIPRISIIIIRIALRLERNKKIDRTFIQVDDEVIEYVSQISVSRTVWHLIELLDALYCMVVNDSIKEKVYFEYAMNDCLKKLIYYGNDNEMSHAVRFLWQLCFNSKIAEDVLNDSKLVTTLKKNSSSLTNLENLRQNCKGCLWMIDKKINNRLTEEIPKPEAENSEVQHIMISYNRDSRNLCLKIKQDLEKFGHKFWIDVENIHGSSLEAMAKAVEGSKCVLMCMTEKYKQSTNCRAEAEYAFQLNKPVIPLIMQQNYKPDGWLGLILGSKIYVDFNKYSYDECLKRVKHELKNIFEISELSLPNKHGLSEDKSIENWTEIQVSEWFKNKKINCSICENLLPCDGQTLKQLFEIMKNAPEFFYFSISFDKQVPLRDVAYFAKECLIKTYNIVKFHFKP